MPFVSYDDLISEMTAGKRLVLPWAKSHTTAPTAALTWYSLWMVGGQPTSGVLTGTNLTFTRTTDATLGALYHGGDKSADTKHLIYMNALSSAGAISPTLMLVDQVGFYPIDTYTSTTQFTCVNTAGPDRYVSAGQSGLQAVVISHGTTVAGTITQLQYVDQDGNTGNMPTTSAVSLTAGLIGTATLGSRVITNVAGPFLPLGAGDCGMRSIGTVTVTETGAIPFRIMMVKPLAIIPTPTAGVPGERDLVMQIGNLERVYDGACLAWLAWFGSTTATTLSGEVDVAWG
jgi:hypothetical protein